MKTVGVVSDTHGLLRPEVAEAFSGVDLIVHAGDIGAPPVLDPLRKIAPVFAVAGNVDRGVWANALPATEIVEVEGQLLYVLHNLGLLDLDPAVADFRVVVYGHSHDPQVAEKRGVVYLNPGSAGPGRFRLPVSVARLAVGESTGPAVQRSNPWPVETFVFGSGARRIEVEMITLDGRAAR